MPEQKRVRRTAQQIIADLDDQIAALEASIGTIEEKKKAAMQEYDDKAAAVKAKIAKLEARKKSMLSPKKRKARKSKTVQIKELVKQAQKSGLKLNEIAEKLGVNLEEE